MSKIDKGIDLKNRVKLLKHLGTALQDEIYSSSQLISFENGKTVFQPDDLLHYFYIILSGRIKIFQLNLNSAREQTIFLLSHGDMFDTVSLLDGKVHEVMNEGLADGELLRLPIEKVRMWIRDEPEFNKIFFPYLAKQMRWVEELATDLSLHTTSERLTRLILKNIDSPAEDSLLHDLSHTEIANLIGTVRHVVDRSLKMLKDESIIDIKRKKISIKNLHSLQEKLNSF